MFSSVAIVCSPYGSTSDTGRKGLAPPLKKRTKEQYCIGTCNVRSMNQGKLEVVKQEMATVNVDIPGISELKWTGMGEFNSDGRLESQNNHLIRAWVPGSFMGQRWVGRKGRKQSKKTIQSLEMSPRMAGLRQGNVLV